jgi:hypothetical protein
MRTIGMIVFTVLKFFAMLFIGVFLFLVRLALGGR